MLFKSGAAMPAHSDNVALKLFLFVGDSLRERARVTGPRSNPRASSFGGSVSVDC